MNSRFHRVTGAAAISTILAPDLNSGQGWQLEEIRVHLSAAGGAGDLTATLDHEGGAEYDLVLLTQDMSTVADFTWQPDRPLEFGPDTELDIAWANANTRTYGLEIVWKSI